MRQNHALTVLLVVEGFALFVGAPLASLGRTEPLVGAGLLGVVVTLALVILSPDVMSKVLAVVAMVLCAGGAAVRLSHPSLVTSWLGHGAVIVAVAAISLVVGRVVFGPGRVTHYRIQGAVILYLNLAIVFGSAYRLIAETAAGAFTNYPGHPSELAAESSMLYFSFTCLTSTGMGEMLPVHPVARSLTNLEAVIGQLYLTILLARLVTLHVASASERS